jgi:hypothetical protein
MPRALHSPGSEAQRTRFVLQQIRIVLEQTRERIHDEIQGYPTPIPACDEHFNHLLAQRREASHALTRVPDAETASSLADCRRLVDDLLTASLLDEESKAKLQSSLLEEGPREGTGTRPQEAPREG